MAATSRHAEAILRRIAPPSPMRARTVPVSPRGACHPTFRQNRAPRRGMENVQGKRLTRRTLLGRAAYGAGSMALASQLGMLRAAAAPHGRGALPTPDQVRADVQRMVDFGPRLTGNDAHNRFIAWLEQEFEAAGCGL